MQPEKPKLSFDAGSLLQPASKRWYWLLFGGMLGALAGGMLGLSLWTTGYEASTQIVRHEAPVASDAYRPPVLRGETLVGMLKLPEIRRRVADTLHLSFDAVPEPKLTPERQGEGVTIAMNGPDPRTAVDLTNAYNRAVIEFTQDYQRENAAEAEKYVAQMLKETEADLADARKALPAGALAIIAKETGKPVHISGRKVEQITAAEEKLTELLSKYTDIHPLVKAQRQTLAALKADVPPEALDKMLTRREGDTAGVGGTQAETEMALYNVRVYENIKQQLVLRQRAIEMFKANPPGFWRVMQPASMDSVETQRPWIKVGLLAAFFGMLGLMASTVEVLRREIFDNRLKTETDVTRVTGLPVLATLGDIRQMSLAARETWAFRTWIALQDRLAYSPNHGLICGFTSSNSGDGRTTWINQLAGAARKCGFRVLTIATRATGDITEESAAPVAEPVAAGAAATNGATNGAANGAANGSSASHARSAPAATNGARLLSNPNDLVGGARDFTSDSEFTALTASALFTPALVTEKLMGPETDPLVHIPLPGWTWNLERRKQWQGALNVWRKIDNVVILVELPPASMPETVLLASNLPNLIWLVESGKSDATDTRNQLETLRHARCNLVGAVINRALTSMTQSRFSRWVNCFALFAVVGLLGNSLFAQTLPPLPASTATVAQANPVVATAASAQVAPAAAATAFSVLSPTQRATWQKKLTLGPGDVLSFSLYGEPELGRTEVPVGPDGRISFLEAHNIMASGLTVDELRDKLNEELSKYRRAAQAFVVPVAYKSKKYYVLGKVTQRGAFPLDRPVTLVEAVARAGGLETGLSSNHNLIELADLPHAFLARNGQRVPVDFEKLFLQGDLTQNVTLEPDDYVYFPGGVEKEVYVLGAVREPGAHFYSTPVGAIGAISGRGGFSDRAWTKKVLVIRGGMNHPETFVLNADEILKGRAPDVTLQPKDVVYVSNRPWIYAEELLDAASNAFITSAIVWWTTDKVTGDPRN
jgi:protein involved in polysaccharide export with SLBB domain/capsular polysaccharide biosynthesis protein